ncbi:MAG: hypothetical protein ABWY52_05320, partial [Candidatus Limnocylindrales bacterium]
EILADVATLIWVVFWGRIVWLLYELIAGFAGAGRTINEGGANLTQAGVDLGATLRDLPLVGEAVSGLVRDALAGAGQPLSDFGNELETFVLIVAAVLALLLALITLVPWLVRYVPWRWRRLRLVRAAHRALRRTNDLSDPQIAQILAMRAVMRLDYPTLLEFTPDPLGDWATGRHDRLARAELASVGLKPG